jgi:aryl-alcohol dehydrogenase-like predicted oxidoreductase
MDMLAEAARAGLARAIGVSNFSAQQMYAAAKRLERHGIPLAANEVHYSLFHRDPERNGVLEACRKLDVALIAYRPLGGGRVRQDGATLDRTLADLARTRQRTPAQVALNWLLCKDEHIIAIPGSTGVAHLRENAGAAGWTLDEVEVAALEGASALR